LILADFSSLLGPFRAERDRRQRKLEKHRFAGELHVTAIYNPPLGNWGGYLTIRGASCAALGLSLLSIELLGSTRVGWVGRM
jgi:hypothetical protein